MRWSAGLRSLILWQLILLRTSQDRTSKCYTVRPYGIHLDTLFTFGGQRCTLHPQCRHNLELANVCNYTVETSFRAPDSQFIYQYHRFQMAPLGCPNQDIGSHGLGHFSWRWEATWTSSRSDRTMRNPPQCTHGMVWFVQTVHYSLSHTFERYTWHTLGLTLSQYLQNLQLQRLSESSTHWD